MESTITLSRVDAAGTTRPATEPAPQPTPDCCMNSLAMAYVPLQTWRNLYEPDVALARGTLFAELDKPFVGEEVRFK